MWGSTQKLCRSNLPGHDVQSKHVIHTTVSRLLAAVPVHLPMILSMHFLWMAALHSDKNIKRLILT